MSYLAAWCRISEEAVTVNHHTVLSAEALTGSNMLTGLYRLLKLEYPKFHKMDVLSQAAFLAVELLKKEAPAILSANDDKVALLFANSEASGATDDKFRHSYEVERLPGPSLFVYTLPNIALGEIAIRNKWYGENMFAVFPKFAAGYFADFTRIMLKEDADVVIGGWVDVKHRKDVFVFAVQKEATAAGDDFTETLLEKLYRDTIPA